MERVKMSQKSHFAKNFALKSLSDGIEGIKDKTLEADPNLETSMTICQDKRSCISFLI